MTSTAAAWEAAFSAVEAQLERGERLLKAGLWVDVDDPALLYGSTLGSVPGLLPLRFSDRASRVRKRTEALVAALAECRAHRTATPSLGARSS